MWLTREMKFALGFAIVAAFAGAGDKSYAQGAGDPNAAPNPYKLDEGWAKLPEGRNSVPCSASRSIATARACGRSIAARRRILR